MKKITIFILLFFSLTIAKEQYYYSNGKRIYLQKETTISSKSISDIPKIEFYKNSRGNVMGVSNEIIIKLLDNNKLRKILKDYNLTLVKKIGKDIYVLKAPDNSSVFDIANKLYQKPYIKYSHPNFIRKLLRR